MTRRQLSIILGIFSVIICLTTWALDLMEIVDNCIYCRNERSIIGLLGILLILPILSFFTPYLTLVLGFYGASVSSQHIMLIMRHSNFSSPHLPLSICALFVIIGQVLVIYGLFGFTHTQSKE